MHTIKTDRSCPDHEPGTHSSNASYAKHVSSLGQWSLPGALRPMQCRLTSKDYMLLESHLAKSSAAQVSPLALLLIRAKLADAQLVMPDDVDPDIATGNSRVVFSTDGRQEESRILVHSERHSTIGLSLSVTSLLGATLLGLRSGQEVPLLRADGTLGHVVLKRVAYQPEIKSEVGQERRQDAAT